MEEARRFHSIVSVGMSSRKREAGMAWALPQAERTAARVTYRRSRARVRAT